jgi:hypothetical protein
MLVSTVLPTDWRRTGNLPRGNRTGEAADLAASEAKSAKMEMEKRMMG